MSDQAPNLSAAPSGELPPADPDPFRQAREAVAALRGRGREPNGRAGKGNTLALKSGLRSLQLAEHPDIAAWHQAEVDAISADLGGDAELSALQRAAVREAARVEVILGALGEELFTHGVLTGKGKTRSATTVYLKALDRFVKLSGLLGLARRARPVGDVAAGFADLHRSREGGD